MDDCLVRLPGCSKHAQPLRASRNPEVHECSFLAYENRSCLLHVFVSREVRARRSPAQLNDFDLH